MGDSPKWVKSRRRRKKRKKREKERAKVGDNNGQATHGARKHAWRTQAAWAKKEKERAKVGDNNGQATHGARKPPGPKNSEFLVSGHVILIHAIYTWAM